MHQYSERVDELLQISRSSVTATPCETGLRELQEWNGDLRTLPLATALFALHYLLHHLTPEERYLLSKRAESLDYIWCRANELTDLRFARLLRAAFTSLPWLARRERFLVTPLSAKKKALMAREIQHRGSHIPIWLRENETS